MRLMQVHRKTWKTDVAMFLTLVMLFSPALVGLDVAWLSVAAKATAQTPPTSAVQPILIVPLTAAEGVPANIAGRVTFALSSELARTGRYAPTRLSIDDSTVKRLIRENLLSEDAVTAVLEQPTPEGIAEIASVMKIPSAAYGTVDSYTYDPSNGGAVKIQVTVRFLTIDLETASVIEEKTVEITEEGSSAPKLKPTPEDTLAAEAMYDAVRKIVGKLIGLPVKPVEVEKIKRPVGIGAFALAIAALLVGVALSGGKEKAGPVPLGPADAPRSVSAVPQVDMIVVSWQPPLRGTPSGYNVYRQAVDTVTFQPIGGIETLTPSPVRTTIYEDRTAQRDRAYIYLVSAVYPDGKESVKIQSNLGIISPTQPAPVGIGVPLPPANLTAQALDAAVRLTWTDINPAGLVIGYRIYRNGVQIADETIVRTTTYMDRGLQNGVVYQYVVRAVSSFGLLSAPSATVTATPGDLAPQPPLNLAARFDPITKIVTLTWQAPPDPDIAYYEVARIVVQETRVTRGLIERAGRPVPTPTTPPTIIQRLEQTQPRLRQQAGSEFDNAVIASNITTTTYLDNVANFMPTPVNNLTGYQRLRYAVRAVDRSGQKGAWSNVAEVVPNTPPPSLTVPPRVIPSSGQVIVDLQPLLNLAQADPEWQIDKAGVRIFRATTKGGTAATTLRPIHPEDVLPIPADGKYVDKNVVNGTRYFYAVELVDKLGVPGTRSPEAVATPFSTATITITPQGNRMELSGNGQDKVQLTVTVLDSASRPVAGLPLQLSLQGVGTLTIDPIYDDPHSADPLAALTNENGQVIATYQTALVASDTTVTITVAPNPVITGVAPAQLTLTLRAPVVASVELQPQQTQLVADGQSFTRVTITVRDRLGNPMPNQTINLSVSPAQGRFEDLQGNIITQISSGATGTVDVVYRSGTRAGSVTLTASVGAISGQAVVTLVSGSPAIIDLVVNPTTAKADGQTEIRIVATVKDANGNAVPNAQVSFSAIPTLNITPSTVTTDSTGQATTIAIAPTQAGDYTLTARVGTISKSVTIRFIASEPSTIALSAERTQLFVTLPARYGNTDYSPLSPFSRTVITAAVRDENGNPVGGVVVSFQANFGIIQSTATTNEQGIAQVIFVAPSIAPQGPVTINAQAGSATATLDLTVVPGPPAKVRMTAMPLALPADGRTSSQIRIEVRDANDNFVADGTQVRLTLTPNIGSVQSPVATVNGIANSAYIPSTQTGEVTITAIAQQSYILDGQQFTFSTDPNDPGSIAQVRILVGAQIQIVRTAPNFRTSVSVSSSASSQPSQRTSLRTRPPVENTSDLTFQLVDGRGNNVPTAGVQVRVRSSDPQVLFVELQGGQETGNASLQELLILTDTNGQATVRYYSSPIAGNVQVTAELLDPQGIAFSSETVNIAQRPGDPASITIATPSPNLIFVPGAGTPTQTTINAQVFDAANNRVESGIPVRFSATLAGRSVGTFSPTTTLTNDQGQASSTLTSTLDTGVVTVTATASVAGQQQPATGNTTVAFVTGVTAISVTARDSRIGGATDPNDNIPDSTVITAQFTGTIPNGTRVIFNTTRGTFDPQSTTPVRQRVVAVTNNTAQITLHAESVTTPVIARVSISVLNAQGQPVTGSVDVTIVPVPGPIELRPIQIENTTLVVSSNNSTNPAARQPLDPNQPNSTTVTVSVREQGTNAPVPNASVTLSSSDDNSLWVIGNTARLKQITANTDSNGQIQATFYTSTTAGEVTITAILDLGSGQTQQRQATITQLPGPPLITVTADRTEIFVRLPDNFNGHDYTQLPRSAKVTATIADANGNPYKDVVVNFSAANGIISNTATTGNDGKAVVDYSPPINTPANGQDTITAQIVVNGNTLSASTTLRIRPGPPAQATIIANPSELQPDGRSTSTVTVTVVDANNNPVKDGTQVTLALLQGSAQGTIWLPNRQTQITVATSNGQAQAILQAGNQAGVANIQATAQENIQQRTYSAQATLGLPVGVALQLVQVNPTDIFVSKRDYTSFGAAYPNTANVTVRISAAVSGVTVILSSSDPQSRWRVGGSLSSSNTVELTTDASGQVQATYVASPIAGQVTITATVGSQSQSVTINQRPGPMQITLQLQRPAIFVQLPAAYSVLPQSTEVTVTTADENGNPYANQNVQLVVTTRNGPTGSLTAASGRTDGQGRFVTTYQSPAQVPDIQADGTGKAIISARSGNVQGQVEVQILPGPPAMVTLTTDKQFIPSNEEATLTARVIDANGNRVRDGILVSFRLISGPSDVVITPQNNGQVQNSQAQATLRAGNTSGRAIVEAVAEQVENGNRFTASAQLTLNVATIQPPVIVQELQVSPARVVVSTTNAVDPTQRQPLDPTRPNRAQATATVVDQNNGQPVAGMLVVFRVERNGNRDDNALLVSGQNRAQGQITVITDNNGRATVDIYSPMQAGQVKVKASVDPTFPNDPKTKEVDLVFEPGLPVLVLNADKQQVRLEESANVTVSIKDGNGNPFANQQVQIQVDQGSLADGNRVASSLTVVTDNQGEKVLAYYPPQTLPQNRQATVTAQATVNNQSLTSSATVRLLPGVPAVVQLSANPNFIPNDGMSTSVVTATVKDKFGNDVEDGVTVKFKIEKRVFGAEDTKFLPISEDEIEVFTINGQAQATLRAGTVGGAIKVTASVNSVISNPIYIVVGAVLQVQASPTNIFVSKKENDYPSFGDNYPNTAVVTVSLGVNVKDVSVELTSSDPQSRWRKPDNTLTDNNSIELVTDKSGQAKATYVASPKAGQVTITATLVDNSSVILSQSVTINQQPGPPVVTVSAQPTSLYVRLADPQYAVLPQQSQITIKVEDENGNPHADASVTLTATAGTLQDTSGQTDNQGEFTTTYIAPSAPNQSVKIDANIRTARGESASASTTLTILPGPPAIVELGVDKLTLNSTDQAKITVIVKDANGNLLPDAKVTLTPQTSPGNAGKVMIEPEGGLTDNSGQFTADLKTENALPDTVRVIVNAEQTIAQRTFTATSQLSVFVGIQVVLDLRFATNRLVVSDTNATDPTQRKPLDLNRQNKTLVTVTVQLQTPAASDIIIPVMLISSDDNTLWQDVSDLSRVALKQLPVNVSIRSGQQQGSAQATFYASTKRALNIANEPSVAVRATIDPTFTDLSQPDKPGVSITKKGDEGIIQEAGPPAQIALEFSNFHRAPDGTPYLNITEQGTIIATVTDANGNPIPNQTINFSLSPNEGELNPASGQTDTNGQIQATLKASTFTTELTLRATSGSITATQTIRYSVSIPGLNITADPAQIPDDNTTTSLITITSSAADRPLPQNLKFKLSADLGATLSAGNEGTDQATLNLVVGNGQPTGEGTNEARAYLKGPVPDLSQTQNRTITLTASLIVDGMPRTFTQTVTLLPRIQIVSNFGLSNNPNQLVVSSSNDPAIPSNRQPLDGVPGHNKAVITVIVNGAAPSNRLVTISSTDPAILFKVTKGSNKDSIRMGSVSGNLDSDNQYEVEIYSSTFASPNVTINISVLGVNRSVSFEQVPGLPAQVTVLAQHFVIGVTGHPTLPTSTPIQAIVRDAAGNIITTPGINVYFTADAGTLNPPSAPAVNGIAQTTLTSNNETRTVRVFARAVAPTGAEAVGMTTVIFAVGLVNLIQLRANRPDDGQGNVPVPAGETVRVTAVFSPTGSVPDGVRVQLGLSGAYGVVQSVSPTSNNQCEIVILNNNTSNVSDTARLQVSVYDQQGNLVASPFMNLIMQGTTVQPVVALSADPTSITVSENDSTDNPNDRQGLYIDPTNRGIAKSVLTLTISGLNSNKETVEVIVQSSDPNGLLEQVNNLTPPKRGEIKFNITDNGTGDEEDNTSGIIRTRINYYASRKAETVVVQAVVIKDSVEYGRSSVTILQMPGRVERVFFAVDPPRLAINTVQGEPVEARLIALLQDANSNPVPNERVIFSIEPIPIMSLDDVKAITQYSESLSAVFRAYPGEIRSKGISATQNEDEFSDTLDVTPPSSVQPLDKPLIARGSVLVRAVINPSQGYRIGTGDGNQRNFSGTLPGAPIKPRSVTVQAGNQKLSDDGNGNLDGDGQGSINYDTGAISVTFDSPPPQNQGVDVSYKQVVRVELIDDGNGGLVQSSPTTPNYLVYGTVDYSTGEIEGKFSAPIDGKVFVTYRIRSDWDGGRPREDGYLRADRSPNVLTFEPQEVYIPRVHDGSIINQGSISDKGEAVTDVNGIAIIYFRSVNVSQPVMLKAIPRSNPSVAQSFRTFFYVPVRSIETRITEGVVAPLYNWGNFEVEFRFDPPEALPLGSRIWVRIYGFIHDGNDDRDAWTNEDPLGAYNPDQNKDGLTRLNETAVPDDDGDGRSDEDPNPLPVDVWITNNNSVVSGGIEWARVDLVAPGVVRIRIINRGQGPNPAVGWKCIQIFCWNRDGIRLMGQVTRVQFQ